MYIKKIIKKNIISIGFYFYSFILKSIFKWLYIFNNNLFEIYSNVFMIEKSINNT